MSRDATAGGAAGRPHNASPAFRELVAGFVDVHRTRRWVVASADPAAHRVFAVHVPDDLRFTSVNDRDGLAAPRADPAPVAPIAGVTIADTLVDAATAHWLDERGPRLLAWTVDDRGRANGPNRLGAGALTTDNLAQMALLGGQRRGGASFDEVATPDRDGTRSGGVRRSPPRDRRRPCSPRPSALTRLTDENE
jgi:hypothetical protein